MRISDWSSDVCSSDLAITGGTGADTFNFLDTNTGKTEATADKITDFLYSADHIHTGVGAGTLAEYTEGTYAEFASFLANADSADTSLAAGQVGDTVCVAEIGRAAGRARVGTDG